MTSLTRQFTRLRSRFRESGHGTAARAPPVSATSPHPVHRWWHQFSPVPSPSARPGTILRNGLRSVATATRGPRQVCLVFGPTCDALDTISLVEQLPDLELGDLVYSENIGAYSHASSTYFNGFPPAKVVHVNQ